MTAIQAPDAATMMGDANRITDSELQEIQSMAHGEYRKNVREGMPRDYVTMYHPDGSTSIVQLPPLGRTGKGRQDRIQKITHYMVNKTKNGKRWWYASPPEGWVPQALPWRCPVQECSRAGGLKDLLNLWRHITNKHPGEKELYDGVLKAIRERLAAEVAVDLNKLLIGGDNDTEMLVSEEDLAAAKFEDAASILGQEPELMTNAVPAKTFEPDVVVKHCDCGWADKSGKGMAFHKNVHCPLRKKEG